MPAVILSPHLDDAVLSCWHVLTGPGDVTVINVFAGVPHARATPAWWDARTGATDSAQRVRERIEEDRRALQLAGREAINLDFLDEQYRGAAQPADPVSSEILARSEPDATLYAPAAFADHADHALVHTVALGLRDRGFDVCLYADLPHAVRTGAPDWCALHHPGATAAHTAPRITRLSETAHAAKLAAVRRYATQLPGLEAYTGRPLSDPDVLATEVIWPVPAPVGAGRLPAPGR